MFTPCWSAMEWCHNQPTWRYEWIWTNKHSWHWSHWYTFKWSGHCSTMLFQAMCTIATWHRCCTTELCRWRKVTLSRCNRSMLHNMLYITWSMHISSNLWIHHMIYAYITWSMHTSTELWIYHMIYDTSTFNWIFLQTAPHSRVSQNHRRDGSVANCCCPVWKEVTTLTPVVQTWVCQHSGIMHTAWQAHDVQKRVVHQCLQYDREIALPVKIIKQLDFP